MSSVDLESPTATSHLTRENSQNAKPVSLRRSVGLPEAIALLVGTIIGSGIFATPKWVLLYVGSVGMSLVMWTVCGLIALFGALCYCELGTLISKSGGEYAYLMEAYGPLPAFLCSYIYVLFVKPSGIMVLLVFGAYVSEPFFPGCGDSEHLVPLVKILAAAALGKNVFFDQFFFFFFFRYLKRCETLYSNAFFVWLCFFCHANFTWRQQKMSLLTKCIAWCLSPILKSREQIDQSSWPLYV